MRIHNYSNYSQSVIIKIKIQNTIATVARRLQIIRVKTIYRGSCGIGK